MKFRLTFKTPDVLEQIEAEDEEQLESFKRLAKKYIDFGEYITIEFDSKTQTCKVVS